MLVNLEDPLVSGISIDFWRKASWFGAAIVHTLRKVDGDRNSALCRRHPTALHIVVSGHGGWENRDWQARKKYPSETGLWSSPCYHFQSAGIQSYRGQRPRREDSWATKPKGGSDRVINRRPYTGGSARQRDWHRLADYSGGFERPSGCYQFAADRPFKLAAEAQGGQCNINGADWRSFIPNHHGEGANSG